MKLFFKFFWMGLSKLLCELLFITLITAGAAVPILVGITFGFILNKFMNLLLTVLFSIIIAIICYCIMYIIYHSIKAVMYCHKHNTDSLKNAWEKTSIDWDSFS